FDRSVEGGDKAGFLAFEELVEGDRGDAGCLDDRLDRGAGTAALRDQPLGCVEDPLTLRRREGDARWVSLPLRSRLGGQSLREVLHESRVADLRKISYLAKKE